MTLQNELQSEEKSKMESEHTLTLNINSLVTPLYKSRVWIRLFAACLIFYGALSTVTGVAVLVAWIPMWIGVLLFLTSRSITRAYRESDEKAFMQMISRLKTIFTILGFSSVALIIASIYFVKYAIEKSLF
jgi:hypothetical protein